jgi:hypothetical protein
MFCGGSRAGLRSEDLQATCLPLQPLRSSIERSMFKKQSQS